MLLGYDINEEDNKISKHLCDVCGIYFELCPPAPAGRDWKFCLAKPCKSYDPDSDLDLLVDDDGMISIEDIERHSTNPPAQQIAQPDVRPSALITVWATPVSSNVKRLRQEGSFVNYKIVAGPEKADIEDIIVGLLRDGWQFVGGVSCTVSESDDYRYVWYAQAMVLPNKDFRENTGPDC